MFVSLIARVPDSGACFDPLLQFMYSFKRYFSSKFSLVRGDKCTYKQEEQNKLHSPKKKNTGASPTSSLYESK